MNQRIETPEQVIHVARITAFGMFSGALVFAAVAWFIAGAPPAQGPEDQLISIIQAGISLPELVLFFMVPSLLDPQRMSSSSGSLQFANSEELKPYQAKFFQMIVQFALLEGACFLNLIAYIIEQNWWSFGLAIMFLLFMLSNFPTNTRFKFYAETQQYL